MQSRTILHLAGNMVSKLGSDRFGYLKDRYNVYADQLEHAVKTTLNHLEMISLQIQEDYIDEKIAMLHLVAMVKYFYQRLEPYISELRKTRNDNLIYIELEKLALAWKSGKSLLSYPKTNLF